VADNCTAIMSVLERGKPNEIYNISANQEFTNIETINLVCNAMGKGHDLISFIPDPRTGHDFRYAIDTTKIRELGWKPTYKFKDGIKDTVQWYLDNQWFLK
jgi:dTDP-glucose 4,6-dehydratase